MEREMNDKLKKKNDQKTREETNASIAGATAGIKKKATHRAEPFTV